MFIKRCRRENDRFIHRCHSFVLSAERPQKKRIFLLCFVIIRIYSTAFRHSFSASLWSQLKVVRMRQTLCGIRIRRVQFDRFSYISLGLANILE